MRRRASALTEEFGGGCARAADHDGDGWQDLLVCGRRRQIDRDRSGMTDFVVATAEEEYGIGSSSVPAEPADQHQGSETQPRRYEGRGDEVDAGREQPGIRALRREARPDSSRGVKW